MQAATMEVDWHRTPVQMVELVLRSNLFRIVGRYYDRLWEAFGDQKATRQWKEIETITIPELAEGVALKIKGVLKVLNPVHDVNSWTLATDAIERALVQASVLAASADEHASWTSFTGEHIRRLMRQNGVSIRDLAQRMNISMKRVREVRANGVTGNCYCRDWYEGITCTGLFATKR